MVDTSLAGAACILLSTHPTYCAGVWVMMLCANWPILPCDMVTNQRPVRGLCDQSEGSIAHPRIVTRHYIIDPG